MDNSSYPLLNVEFQMTLMTPADGRVPVPVTMMFSRSALPSPPGTPAPAGPASRGAAGGDPPATEQLISVGWGYAFISPASIQADNGAGLTKGIIGLVNKGQPRKPDDWGALRAWAWGASRGPDYLETDKVVDAARVGIEGVSRYGKAALESPISRISLDNSWFLAFDRGARSGQPAPGSGVPSCIRPRVPGT